MSLKKISISVAARALAAAALVSTTATPLAAVAATAAQPSQAAIALSRQLIAAVDFAAHKAQHLKGDKAAQDAATAAITKLVAGQDPATIRDALTLAQSYFSQLGDTALGTDIGKAFTLAFAALKDSSTGSTSGNGGNGQSGKQNHYAGLQNGNQNNGNNNQNSNNSQNNNNGGGGIPVERSQLPAYPT